MRHRKHRGRFARNSSHRKATIKSLIRSLFLNERIITPQIRAKEVARVSDKLITIGKKGDLSSRRRAFDILQDHKLVKKLFDDVSPRYKEIQGGYTRVLGLDTRRGDNAQMAVLEFTKARIEKSAHHKKEKPRTSKEKDAAEHKAAPEAKKPYKEEVPHGRRPLKGIKRIFKKERDSL